MTREPKAQPSSLQKWNEATARDIVTELERLALVPAFYRPDMDARKWAALFQTYYEDLKGVSVEQLRDGCRRWRNNPDNTKFPTPGQLKEVCRNPFETPKGRRYDPLPDDLPPIGQCVTPERMRSDLAQHGLTLEATQQKSIALLKEEILARPRAPYRETPEDVKRARTESLARRLAMAGEHYG